ncbi:uncharacterized protein J3D65DRAFT_175248 [Phyllosticta citribraziliensis]|uniref:Galactose oxidase n=1 Tax=Phyllosticta citribraziliensis TaxID=989973 RepID=A0ABR1L1T5_9PEZI
MAEIATGALVAEQVISTTVEGGLVAGYAIAQPTVPLKASLKRVAVSELIRRQWHSINVIDGKAYVFGGITHDGLLAGNEMHQITLPGAKHTNGLDYHAVPAIGSADDSPVPSPRAGHSAVVAGAKIVIWGGRDEHGNSLNGEAPQLWIFDTTTLRWSHTPVPDGPRDSQFHHGAALWRGNQLVVYGGFSKPAGAADLRTLPSLSTIDIETGGWQSHADQTLSPITPPSAIAVVEDKVYTVGAGDRFQSPVHVYDLASTTTANKDIASATWTTIQVPANPLVQSPSTPRSGAGLLPVSTGHGRHYLLYLFGQAASSTKTTSPSDAQLSQAATADTDSDSNTFANPDSPNSSLLYSFQLPSHGTSLAAAKDGARDVVGLDSGAAAWAEVDIALPTEEYAHEGKAHPGPRANFACANVNDKTVVIWGGVDARGVVEGDGWIIGIE